MGVSTRVFNLCFGRPLATSEERAEHIGPLAGIPVFGLDALSSAAYGPEAALTLLIPLGLMGVKYIVPVSAAIVILLVDRLHQLPADHRGLSAGRRIVHGGQPEPGRGRGVAGGGGADDRLHPDRGRGHFGGVGALISAVPSLQPHTLGLCLAVLAILTLVNMRGVHDTGVVFMIPTYLFTGTLLIVIGAGAWQVLHARGIRIL